MENTYLDYNASTPVDSFVFERMEPFIRHNYGNPSSFHSLGRLTAKALKDARKCVASLIEAEKASQIIFTSGGTESINSAIFAALHANSEKKEIITSAVEHSSVRNLVRKLGKGNFVIHEISINKNGELDLKELKSKLSSDVALVTLMMSNNETGVLLPVKEVSDLLKDTDILFHVDAVQSIGKQKVSVSEMDVDFLSLAAHKFYGPKGVGALYVKNEKTFDSFISGGSQERGRRAGTENVSGIVGLGAASELLLSQYAEDVKQMKLMRDYFEKELTKFLNDISINGLLTERLPNTSNITFEGADGEALLFAMDAKGIFASSGSACKSGAREPSHVLKAMGRTDDETNSSIRFSFGRYTKKEEVSRAVEVIVEIVENLRKISLEEQHQH